MRRSFPWISAGLLVFWIAGASAAADDVVRTRDETADEPEDAAPENGSTKEQVTVTATTSALPSRRVAVPVQVITREQIVALATADIENVLETIPGILVQRNTPFSLGATTVSFQGAAADQVAILLDGKPFAGGVDGVVDLRDIPVANIERIEIVRGPSSALYGSQAMAGVINVITRDGVAPSGALSFGAGTFDRLLVKAAFGGRAGRANYFVSTQAGSYKPAEQWGDDFSVQLLPNDRQDRGQVFFRLDVPLRTQEVQVSATYLEEDNPRSHNRNPSVHAHWNKRFRAGTRLQLTFDRHGYFRENDAEGFEERRDYHDGRAEARLKHAFFGHPSLGKHLLTAGYRLRRESLASPVVSAAEGALVPEPIDEAVDQHTIYLQDEVFVGERWSLAAAIGIDDHERYGRFASPRIGLAWTPGRSRLSVSWGGGYRAPTLLQLFDKDVNIVAPGSANPGYQILGNTDLEPEENRAWNAQYDYGGKSVRGFAHAFVTRYEQLIATTFVGFDPTTFRYVNVDGARTAGVDLGLDVDLGRLAKLPAPHGLQLAVAFGYLTTESESSLPNEDRKHLPFRPARTWSPRVHYSHEKTGTHVNVWANYKSEQYTSLNNVDVIDPHWSVNVKIVQRLFAALELVVEGTNVTDVRQSARSTLDDSPPSVPLTVSPEAWLVGLTYRIGNHVFEQGEDP